MAHPALRMLARAPMRSGAWDSVPRAAVIVSCAGRYRREGQSVKPWTTSWPETIMSAMTASSVSTEAGTSASLYSSIA
jgi:hypothetical protein